MNSLRQFQSDFINAVTDSSNADDLKIHQHLQQLPALTGEQQLSIYQSSIMNTLTDALQMIYPVCRQLTGEDFFRTLCRHYIHATPSRSADIANYGEQLSEFIQQYPAAQSIPYLSEMAAFEWLYHRAFYAHDGAAFDFSIFQQYTEQQLMYGKFYLPCSLQTLNCYYPVDSIWEMHKINTIENLTISRSNFYIIILRHQYDVIFERIAPSEYQFIHSLAHHSSFLAACDALNEDTDVNSLLYKALQHGWINRFHPAIASPDLTP